MFVGIFGRWKGGLEAIHWLRSACSSVPGETRDAERCTLNKHLRMTLKQMVQRPPYNCTNGRQGCCCSSLWEFGPGFS